MFIVTGATGRLGRAIVHALVERVPDAPGRRGEFAAADDTLSTLLGRAPTPMRQILAARCTEPSAP